MTDLTSLTLAEARSGLASKSFTSLELTDAHLAAIEACREALQDVASIRPARGLAIRIRARCVRAVQRLRLGRRTAKTECLDERLDAAACSPRRRSRPSSPRCRPWLPFLARPPGAFAVSRQRYSSDHVRSWRKETSERWRWRRELTRCGLAAGKDGAAQQRLVANGNKGTWQYVGYATLM